MPDSSTTLRRRLLLALSALVATAGICSVLPRTPVAAVPVVIAAAPAPPVAVETNAPVASVAPAPLRASGGCGLTLGGPASAAPVGRCTVLVIGDSLGSDLGWGLARELAPASGISLIQRARSSTGLAVPGFYDWPSALAVALRQTRPQLVIVMLGGNDQQGMVVRGKPVQFGTPGWRAAYVARVHALAREATDAGAFVLWVGLPVMEQPTYDRGARELDADFQAGTAGLPRAAYLSTRALFAGAAGNYVSDGVVHGARTPLRQSDGIHLSLDGENVAATVVLQHISATFGVRLTPRNPETPTPQG